MASSRQARAVALLVASVFFSPGCGRSLPGRDAGPPAADTAVDRAGDGPDGPPSGEVAPADARADLVAEVGRDTLMEAIPDAPEDRPDAGPVDVTPAPDLGPPDAGRDSPSDRRPDGDASCGAPYDLHHCGTCDHDCTALPGVNPSPESLACMNGVCVASLCKVGYGHCVSTSADQACETDLASDTHNCGGCGVTCGQVPGSPGVCHNGACVGECPAGFGDCTDDFGCETRLDSPENCGACGRAACSLANVIAPCQQPATCEGGICAPGHGNCDHSSPDCEAVYGGAGGCVPAYEGTAWVPSGQNGAMGVAGDGTRYIGGQFTVAIDFDSSSGVDKHSPPGAVSPYVTMIEPDGRYGWTRTFRTTGPGSVVALAGLPGGGVIVGGTFQGGISLDPDGVTTQYVAAQSTFIVELTRAGDFVSGLVLEAMPNGSFINLQSLAVAADGSIYAGGSSWGEVDFDPGSGTVVGIGSGYPEGSPFLVKLNADRSFAWVDTWDVDPSACVIYPGRLAASPDGRVWMGGSYGGACDLDPGAGVDVRLAAAGSGGEGYVLALDAAGGYVGSWTFGTWVEDLVADSQGAIHAAGSFYGTVDFDPGPAEALRATTTQPESFVVKLDAAGDFEWVSTQAEFTVAAVALGPGGTVLLAGMLGGSVPNAAGVVELLPDQSPGWTIGFGTGEMNVSSVATTASGFFVGGFVYWNADLDPGTGVVTVPGGSPEGTPFLSAFAF